MGIHGRVASALAATVVLLTSASVGAVEAAPSAADPYSTRITTKVTVRTPSPIRTDTRLVIKVLVTANSPRTPRGEVELTLRRAPGGGGQARAAGPADWTRTVPYDGGTVKVAGPEFDKAGDWLVGAVFTPDDTRFRGSRDGWVFEVVDGSGDQAPDDDNDDNDDNGGLLPDTGGPALLWVLLGVGLLGGGSAAVVVARRRRETVPTTV